MKRLLQLEGIGKDYAKVDSRGGRLRLVADLLRGRPAAHVFRALDDVTLELNRGESLGVIGENGAGKSTLLKIVAGVIKPTRGTVAVNGRVGALLELGSGFHPEYTGRANIDLAATLLGLAPAEINARSVTKSSPLPTSASTSTIRSSTTRRAWSCDWASRSPPRCRRTS